MFRFQLDQLLYVYMADHTLNSDLRKIRLAPDHSELNCFRTVWNVLCNYGVYTVVARARSWRKSTQLTYILPNKYFKQDRQCTYAYRTIVVRSSNRSYNGNPTVRTACISERRVTVTVNRQKQDRQCRCNVQLKRFRAIVVAMYYIFWMCVCSHSYRARKRMCRIKLYLSSVVCLAVQYFSTLSHKYHGFRKESYWILTVYFDFPYSSYPKYFSLQEEFREVLP